ncbi:MAG: hypothetical protein P9X27_03255 [Candidatus Kaelpia aquatica]|nr:hypothetical protein [Candidatus Kaelpia aquatica]
MKKINFAQNKNLKRIYLHPHGLGDLILSMPSIEYIMGRDPGFGLVVRDKIYNCGFFNNFPYKERVFFGCPPIWDRTQVIKSFKRIDRAVEDLRTSDIDAHYLKFNKNSDRRLQVNRGLGKCFDINITFDDGVYGRVYLEKRDIDWAKNNAGLEACFFHSYSGPGFKSVLPLKFKKIAGLEEEQLFIPILRDNINLNFAVQKLSKINVVIDSAYMHSSAAMGKDIDLLFVSFKVKNFFQTLKPNNININKIVYGNLSDSLNSFFFYKFREFK